MMRNTSGRITATEAPTTGAANETAATTSTTADTSLPDPTSLGKLFLIASLGVALAIAVLFSVTHWNTASFEPPKGISTQFGLLAGFYVAAQVIERLLELVSPMTPFWPPPPGPSVSPAGTSPGTPPEPKPLAGATGAAYIKADRAAVLAGIASILGVVASAGFGLYFLSKFGIKIPRHELWIDIFVSGVVIGAGTKPLHDFVSLIQAQTNPKTGTGTDGD